MRNLGDVKFRGYYPYWRLYDDMESGWIVGLLYYDFDDEEYGIQNEDGIYFVDYKSIGQYTGLVDSNREEIYEGDIIKSKEGDVFPAIVKYGKYVDCYGGELYGLYLDGKSSIKPNKPMQFKVYSDLNIEIIGNIYENPELIR